MSTELQIFIVSILIGTIAILSNIIFILKKERKKSYNLLPENVIDIESVTIHPIVKQIFNEFIKNWKLFEIDSNSGCTMKCGTLPITIWAANDKSSRYFYSDCILDGTTVKKANSELTSFDKEILDTIVQRVKVNHSAFVELIFLK